MISIYGYSMAIFIILEVCFLVPLTVFKWAATFTCAGISLFFLNKEILDLTHKYLPQKDLKFLVYYVVGSHAFLILLLKFYFFN